MSISALRHKYLDLETNIGTSDLRNLVTDEVYTAAIDRVEVTVPALGDVKDKISDMVSNVTRLGETALKNIKKALDKVLDGIMNSKLGSFVKGVLDKLKGLNLDGLKSFLKSAIKAGTNFICNNLDTMKNLTLGLTLGTNILKGMLLGLALGWLDKYCKGFSQNEWKKANNESLLEMTFGKGKIEVDTGNVLSKVGGAMSGLLKKGEVPVLSSLPSPGNLVSSVLDGTFKVDSRSMEFDSGTKSSFIGAIDTGLSNFGVGTREYMSLLQTRGDIINAPIVSQARRLTTNGTETSSSALGNLSKELADIDLTKINKNTLTDTELGLLEVASTLKYKASSDTDLLTRGEDKNSYDNYDWSDVTASLDPALVEEIKKMDSLPESKSNNGLHPTTRVFIEDTVEGVAIKSSPVGGGQQSYA